MASPEEKYRAKLVIDTVVQRVGDAMAAALFQVLQARGKPHTSWQAPNVLEALVGREARVFLLRVLLIIVINPLLPFPHEILPTSLRRANPKT